MKDRWKLPLVVLSVAGLTACMAVVLIQMPQAAAQEVCTGVPVKPGDDLDAIVNGDSRTKATTFCVQASDTPYQIDHMVVLNNGDRILGEPGEVVTRGPASYGVPLVQIRPQGTVGKMITLRANIELRWLDIGGAVTEYHDNGSPVQGTGTAIRAGQTTANSLMEYLVIHDNDNQGIGTMNGKLRHSELYKNGTDTAFGGVTAAAVKGIDEYEASFNYVHDNPAVGLWCDVGCDDAGAAMPNGYWVRDNLVVDNGRSGIRYESAPEGLATGVHASEPTALIVGNEVHGNSYNENRGAISAVDAQNALIRNNIFGTKTIEGVVGTNTIDSVTYGPNAFKPGAVKARDSGKTSRTDLWNIDIQNNTLNGEELRGCELPDVVVDCQGNY